MRKNILILVFLVVIKCRLCQENSGDDDSDVGSGDSNLEVGDNEDTSNENIEDVVGSGSGDIAPVVVAHSVTYSMSSSDGSFDIGY